jgi:hypothetical protein
MVLNYNLRIAGVREALTLLTAGSVEQLDAILGCSWTQKGFLKHSRDREISTLGQKPRLSTHGY